MSSRNIILVIDDDDDVRLSVSLLLGDEGYDVVEVANGKEALDVLARGLRPDAILLDLMMPVMSGWDFWDAHQASSALRAIPVVVLTATGLRQGAVGEARVIGKPVGVDELKDAVATAVASAPPAG
jgi:CheY-like chemotaxis protein